jgi:MFS family permease
MAGSPREAAEAPRTEEAVAASAVRRIARRIIPYLMLCYLVSYIDRVNVGFAAFQMNADLGLSPSQFGIAGGIFFVAYFLFEIPSNLALEFFGARRWIARIMITWGLIGTAMAFATGATSLYALRFLMGAAEAGFFPGIILYLTYWLPRAYRARMVSLFMLAIPLSSIVGSPLSGALLALDGALGLRGWQILFIVESVPAVLLGLATLWLLPERPDAAMWLPEAERTWLTSRLAEEARVARPVGKLTPFQLLANRYVLALALAVGAGAATSTALSIWQPQILKSFGISGTKVGFLNAVPFAVACVAMVLWGRRSDRSGERVWHTVLPLGLAACAFASTLVIGSLPLLVLALSLALAGTYALKGPVWALSTEWLSHGSAAAGIAAINALGNLWGSVMIWAIGHIKDATGSFALALLPLVALNAAGALAILWIGRNGAARVAVPPPGGRAAAYGEPR